MKMASCCCSVRIGSPPQWHVVQQVKWFPIGAAIHGSVNKLGFFLYAATKKKHETIQ